MVRAKLFLLDISMFSLLTCWDVSDNEHWIGMEAMRAPQMVKAILTDVQFWVPAVVLAGGVVLLVVLH